MHQFEEFRASTLFCKKCRQAMPVRERLLLVLPDKEIYDYLCTGCGDSLGQREVIAGDRLLMQMQKQIPPRPGTTDHSPGPL